MAQIKKIEEENCIVGQGYLLKRSSYPQWMMANYNTSGDFDYMIWSHADGLTTEPIEIYEILDK